MEISMANDGHGKCGWCSATLDFKKNGISIYRCAHCQVPYCAECRQNGLCVRCGKRARKDKNVSHCNTKNLSATLDGLIDLLMGVVQIDGNKVVDADISIYDNDGKVTNTIYVKGSNRR